MRIEKSGKKVTGIIMAAIILASIFITFALALGREVPIPDGEEGIYFLDPKDSSAPEYCNSKIIEVWVNTSLTGTTPAQDYMLSGKVTIETTDKGCANITDCHVNATEWSGPKIEKIEEGGKRAWMTFGVPFGVSGKPPGSYNVGTITVHCNSSTYCIADLNFVSDSETYIADLFNTYNVPGDNGTFTCEIEMPAPNITSFHPPSHVSDYKDASRTFNISVNQSVNVTWLINGSVVKDTEKAVTEANYTNTSAKVGTWNVSAVVENANGTDMQTWIWNVMEPPVLVNEFLVDNSSGAYNDWVELYNPTGSAVDLSGWALNDSDSQMKALSGSILAGEHQVVDVSNRLNKGSDSIILLKPPNGYNGTVVDQVTYGTAADNAPEPPTDNSTGRHPDGVDTGNDSADFKVFDTPTPGAPNTIYPKIIGSAPTSPVSDNEGATRTFNITVDQTVTVVWKINGTQVQTNASETEVSYTNTSAVAGYWEVTATASNTNGSVTQTWWWTVNDITAPNVTNWAPTGTNVDITTNITATFSEAMNESTLNTSTVLVENSTGAVTGAVNYDSATKTVTFDPVNNLNYSETCNVTITTGVADLAGNNMTSNYTWNFTTSAPPSTTVAIADVKAAHGESIVVPIMVNYVTNLGGGEINVSFNQSVVHVTDVTSGDMGTVTFNINNASGWVYMNTFYASGKSGDVIFANITLTAKGSETEISPLNITIEDLFDTGYDYIPHYVSNGSFTVKDVTKPVYEWIKKPETGTTGEDFNVSVFATDNVGVTDYTITVDGVDYDMTQNGDYYNYTIHVPWNSTANIIYNCTFKDAEGNSNSTGNVPMAVTDNDEPTIINVTGDTSTTTGENASITASFSDNIGVTYNKIFFKQIDGSWQSADITNNTAYNITAASNKVGNISYYVVVNDSAGTGPVGDPSADGSTVYNITVTDNDKPTLTQVNLYRDTILNDNGRPRKPGTNVSVLSVNVTDNVRNMLDWITNVTVNLSELGLSATANVSHESGEYGLWKGSRAIKATTTTGVNLTNSLVVNVTDEGGNWNTSTAYLTVLRRGDVYRDNNVTLKDSLYIARYRAHLEPEWSNPPTVLVGDVVGVGGDPTGDGKVNIMDALYIARYRASLEDEP